MILKAQVAGYLVAAIAAGALANGAVAPAATTLYVDNRTAACSDAGAGDLVQPFCTIAAGIAAAGPGQTVNIVGGTYAEHVVIDKSGEPGQPITLTSFTAKLAGPSAGLTIDGQHDIVVRGFQISGVTAGTAVAVSNSHDVTLVNFIAHVGGTATGYRLADSVRLTVASAYVDAISDKPVGMDVVGVSDSRLIQFGVATNVTSTGSADPGLRLDVATHDVRVLQLNIQNAKIAPVILAGSHNTIAHGYISGGKGAGIRVEPGAVGNVLARNEIRYTLGVGIDVAGSDTAITNNRIWGNCSAGVRVGAASTGTAIENNTFENNGVVSVNCAAGWTDRFGVAAYGPALIDYNAVMGPAGTLYAWQQPAGLSLAEFRSASGQGAHDLEAHDYAELTTLSIDSADSAAAGVDPIGWADDKPYDDPAYANIGAGPQPYGDRGIREIYRWPIAALAVSVAGSQVVGGRTMTFDAGGTAPGSAPIASYMFAFGDGTSVTSTTPQVTHAYTPGGVWQNVFVRVTDALGHSAEASLRGWVPAEAKSQPRCSTAPACRPERSPR